MEKDKKPFITIVSGSPRSGTSMMMRMLEAGGMPVFVDTDVGFMRSPDEFNPHGYYEHRFTAALMPLPLHIVSLLKLPVPTLELPSETAWLADVEGKAVKIFYDGLPGLPLIYDYRIIVMDRPTPETMASYARMSRGPLPLGLDTWFATTKRVAMEWLNTHPVVRIITVSYTSVLASPLAQSNKVQKFLGIALDTVAMAAVVETIP